MEISRKPGWEGRLSAHITAHFSVAFRWGKTDCAMFTAGAIEAMTGVDLAYGLRGYRSEAGGLRKVRGKGFKDHVDVFASRFSEVGIEVMRRGDLALVEQDKRLAMGVYDAGAFVMTPSGLRKVPSSMIVKGYRI